MKHSTPVFILKLCSPYKQSTFSPSMDLSCCSRRLLKRLDLSEATMDFSVFQLIYILPDILLPDFTITLLKTILAKQLTSSKLYVILTPDKKQRTSFFLNTEDRKDIGSCQVRTYAFLPEQVNRILQKNREGLLFHGFYT